MPGRPDAIPNHHDCQDDERDQKIHEADDDRAGRENQAWEVDLAEHVRVGNQAVAGLGERAGKELPGKHGGKDQDWIRDAIGGQFCESAKNETENNHRQERAQNGPENPDDCLLVADQNVAPCQERKELAVAPKVRPVVALGFSGLDDHTGENAAVG